MAIEYIKVKPQRVKVFLPDGTLLGNMNEWEFYEVRVQCREQKIGGVYVMFKGKKCTLNKDGRMDNWPNGLFDAFEKYLDKLL